MKTISKNGDPIRCLGIVAILSLALLSASSLAQEKSSTNAVTEAVKSSTNAVTEAVKSSTNAVTEAVADEPVEYNNSVTLGLGHLFVGDDKAQLMRRLQLPAGTFGGVDELHFEETVGKKGVFKLDGRGIFDNHDYSIKLDLSHPEIGYLRGGYTQFRNWYDGSGGYSPLSNAWVTLYNEELFIDRSRVWFEGGLTLPDWPVFTIRYSSDFRDGMKDSTIWGDYNLSQNGTVLRGILPTFSEIKERRHSIDADMKHSIGETRFGVGLRYERDDIDNSLNIMRRAGEPTRARAVTQSDSTDADILNAHGFVERRFSPKVLFTAGGSYSRLDTDIGGSRIYGPTYGSPLNLRFYANQQINDEGFSDLNGGSRVDQYVANFNFMLTPWKNVAIVPSLRIEHQDQVGSAMFTDTLVNNTMTNYTTEDIVNSRLRSFTDVTEALAARYTGFTNWSLYTQGEWIQGQGSLKESDNSLGPVLLQRDTDSERLVQKYTVGANWYPLRKANFTAQYYYRTRQNDYDHALGSAFYNPPKTANDLYPAFIERHEFDTHDVNYRVTLRPLSGLTLVSRYDFTITSYRTRGATNTFGIPLASVESAEATAHIFSQSISWNPLPQLYFQGSGSYALQRTESPASSLTGEAANLVQNAENDYWTASLLAGCVLTKRSDLQAQYNYYRANNYDASNASVSLPYGAGDEQHGVTLTSINRLRKNLIWKIQYGFFTGHDQTSGGHNDYQAHLVYSSWQYLF